MGKLILTTGDYIENSNGMDAIVNAQNKYMSYGSGICGAIYRASGQRLLDYCKNKYSTNMQTCEVRITPGFDLTMDIIHVLAPKAFEERKPVERLIETYKNVLEEIKNNKYKNVLFNSLGTGIHGYNHNDVAKPIINLLYEFCNNNDINIYFNNIYPLYKDIYLNQLLHIKGLSLQIDLKNKSSKEIKKYLIDNCLTDILINVKYTNFVENKNIDDMCLSEKLIFLEYAIENGLENTDKIINSFS